MKEKFNELCIRVYSKWDEVKEHFKNRMKDQGGASSVEYALLIGAVVIAIVLAVQLLKDDVSEAVKTVGTDVKKVAGSGK